MANELKACPFCGGEAEAEVYEPCNDYPMNAFYKYAAHVSCNVCRASPPSNGKQYQTKEEALAVVAAAWNTRPAAPFEAIIAARDETIRSWQDKWAQTDMLRLKAEADKAALTARVKELEGERRMIVSHATMGGTDGVGLSVNDISVRVTALRNELYKEGNKRAEALETQLAAVKKALEPFALISSEGVIRQKTGHVSITTCAEYFHRARAALEGRP